MTSKRKKNTTKKSAKKSLKKTTKKAATKRAVKKTTAKASKKVTRKKVSTTARKSKKSPSKSAKGKSMEMTTVKTSIGIQIGQMVPDLIREATGNQSINLRNLNGKKIVLYFYPKDDTPGCTLEGQDFTRLHQQFKDSDTEIMGVSRDSVASHEKFCSKFAFTFTLLSDQDEQLCNAFGVIKDKNMYGKMVRGIERSTFVFDRNGVLQREWRKVSVDGHAGEVLEFVRGLA